MARQLLGRLGGGIAASWAWLARTLASRMLFRRLLLISAVVYMGVIGWRVIAPETLLHIQTPGASVVLGIFGMLTTLAGLYQYLRDKDGDK